MNKRKSTKIDAPSPSELVNQANKLLETGRFRDAIERFKSLIKLQDLPEYHIGLAAAYAGRAKELYSKGMIKEAIAIWNNRQQFCPQSPMDLEHLKLLLKHGQIDNALQLVQRNKSQLDSKQLGLIQIQIAATYLFNSEQVTQRLAADDPILVHGIAVQTALTAYCNNDDKATETALAAVPFRSPYRDFVHIIKALLKFNEDRNGIENLLKRIPIESPFMPLVQAIKLAMLPESAFYSALLNTQANVSEFAATLRGWSATRIKLWQELQTLGEKPSGLALEKFMHKHIQLLEKDWVRWQGLRLLKDNFPRSLTRSSIFIKDKITPLEKSIIAAWCTKETKSTYTILNAWEQVIAILRDSNPLPDSDNALSIALIQRQVEKQLDLLNRQADDFLFFNRGRSTDLESKGESLLEESLNFDPNDLPTYVRLIAHYRSSKRFKDARRLLNSALEIWPDDPALLVEAIDVSTATGAFKKATGFARRLLEIDPINSRARESLLESHLAHFRKQVKNGSFALAEKELTAIEVYIRDERTKLKFDVARGFLTLHRSYVEGIAVFKEFFSATHLNLAKQLALIMEATRMKFAVEELIQKLELALPKQLDAQDFSLFLRLLRETLDKNHKLPIAMLEYFVPAIKKAKDLQLSQENCELLCSTLHRLGLKKLYRLHAGAALVRWPGLPIFELHYFEAKYGNKPQHATTEEIGRLENAAKRAREVGDARIANRIKIILNEIEEIEEYDEEEEYEPPQFHPKSASGSSSHLEKILRERGVDALLEAMKNDPEMSQVLQNMETIMDEQDIRRMFEMVLTGEMNSEKDFESMLLQSIFKRKSHNPKKS